MSTAPTPPNARDVLGVATLPSGRVASGGAALRAAATRLRDAMAPPPVRILEGLFGVLDHRAMVALCDAGVPDALTRRVSPADLARRIGADPDGLERLLRFAATRGWVRIDRRGRVRPTKVTRFLREDHPGGWRAWVELASGDEVTAAVSRLSVQAGTPHPFAVANRLPFFDWMRAHPDRWEVFDRAMAAGGRMHALVLHREVDWSTVDTVCDVGGGTGALLAGLLELEPHLRGTLFDLPEVVARAPHHERMAVAGGSAFEEVPADHDTYLLVNVIHDWSDEDAIRILRRVAGAAGPGSRILIVDAARPDRPRDGLAASADLLMAALTEGGRERSVHDFGRLATAAELRLYLTKPLPTGDVVHFLETRD